MSTRNMNTRGRAVAVLLLGTALAGCATFSEDGGFGAVQEQTRDSLQLEARWLSDDASRTRARADVAALLGKEMSADDAMSIALLSNPTLQAEYANLGISEADLVQAGRLSNPGFTFGKTSGGGGQEIERGLHFNVMALLTMPLRVGIETRRFEAARLAAAAATAQVALAARAAWVEAVSARQGVDYFHQVVASAEASRELMSRMRRVGNASRLELAREQLFHAEALAGLARAQRNESAAREALVRALGLWGEQAAVRLPRRLPDLPDEPVAATDFEQRAIAQRLDIRQARHALDGIASNLDLTRATRFVNVLEAGPAQVRERGEPARDGYEIALEIPLFDQGGARIARAEALYNQAADRLRATALNARSQAREAWVNYRSTYDLARHYRDEIVPLRKRISDEQLLRYNGMLIGVFDLVADAREQVSSVNAYLGALREFWLADTALKASMLVGSEPAMASLQASTPGAPGAGGH